jgi:molybdopterin-guanine dinucleotide biosynthesis protein A
MPLENRQMPIFYSPLTPVWGCVLIGGRSSRMGRPKHLLRDQHDVTWLERTVRLLRPFVTDVVLSGKGEVPDSLNGLIRLPDIPDVAGPLSGILAAMRWQPAVSWLLVACDMPDISEDAIQWLLGRRRSDIWGTVPRLQESGPVEPLLAYYDNCCAPLFEDLLRKGCLRIGMVAANENIETPVVPEYIRPSWRNVNTIEDLQAET